MAAPYFVLFLYHLLYLATAQLVPPVILYPSAFRCTGGSVYFSAHPADSLLYQNPDLLHDLYVFKCVTTVVFTSGDRGLDKNHSLSLEHGLEYAHAWMSGAGGDERDWQEVAAQIGRFRVQLRLHAAIPNMQILYLRLPDGSPTGQGYESNSMESLKKLYDQSINSINATDGSGEYTLDSLKSLIAAILHERKANRIGVLDHKASILGGNNYSDHADHVASAKIVIDTIKQEKINTELVGYAGGFARMLRANMNSSHVDFRRKADAFFKYAEYDQHMCHSYNECFNGTAGPSNQYFPDKDVESVAQSLSRTYYVS